LDNTISENGNVNRALRHRHEYLLHTALVIIALTSLMRINKQIGTAYIEDIEPHVWMTSGLKSLQIFIILKITSGSFFMNLLIL
jgi:hypothetical protein